MKTPHAENDEQQNIKKNHEIFDVYVCKRHIARWRRRSQGKFIYIFFRI